MFNARESTTVACVCVCVCVCVCARAHARARSLASFDYCPWMVWLSAFGPVSN